MEDQKLTLKELAPYLPYNVGGVYTLSKVISLSRGQKDEIRSKDLNADTLVFYLKNCKLILNPLSDLDKDSELCNDLYDSFGLKFDSDGDLEFDYYSIGETDSPFTGYKCINRLLSEHYDVFGLIVKGLAIDINTLKS
jgi:hypothetical protein